MTIYTVGHSHVPIERFLELLARHRIDILADVRSQPHSRFAPQFNRPALAASLVQAGITYHYRGDTLGGRPQDAQYRLPDGTIDYHQVARGPHFRGGLEELMAAAEHSRVAIMCAEADFRHCHRYGLITRALVGAGVDVKHITPAGTLVDTDVRAFSPVPDQLRLL